MEKIAGLKISEHKDSKRNFVYPTVISAIMMAVLSEHL